MLKFIAKSLVAFSLLQAGARIAHATTITFETGTEGPYFTGPITESGYRYFAVSGDLDLDGYGTYIDGAASRDMEGYQSGSSNQGVFGISSILGDFTFSQLDFAQVGRAETIVVTGYLGGVVVGTDTFSLPYDDANFYFALDYTTEHAFHLAGVTLDELQITLPIQHLGEGGGIGVAGAFGTGAIDNVVLNAASAPPSPPIASTPEPASFVLLQTGNPPALPGRQSMFDSSGRPSQKLQT